MNLCSLILGQVHACGFERPQVNLAIAPLLLFAIAFAVLVFSYVLQSFLMPKPDKPKPAGLDDWDFPQVEDGTPETVVFGDGWLEGPMVCWYGNYRTIKIKAKGGK
jgi:hypothetical protein